MSINPYQPKTKNDISYFVNARQKTYLKSTEIYLPDNPYEKLEVGFELSRNYSNVEASRTTSEEDKLDRSVRRAHTAVKDISLTNIFDLFVTFTFKSNRFDDEKCREKMMGWLKRQRKKDKSFRYVIVSELHKRCEECVEFNIWPCHHYDRPKALHFHALIGGYQGVLVRAINPKTNKPLIKKKRAVYDFPNFTLGNSEVYRIGLSEEDSTRTAFYLLKYLKKDMPAFKSKKRYWASRGLNKPVTIDNPEEWYLAVTPDHMIETPYGKYLFFDNKRIEIFLP